MAPQAPGAVGFVVPEVKPREPETGWSVGIYGGPNLGQFADGANSNFSSNIHGAGGVKLAYTWPFDQERTDQFQDEFGGFRLSGAVELDAGYVGNRLSGNAFGVVPYSADLDSAVFVVNFLLKGQVGNFRPYIGPGIGAAFHSASNFRVNGIGNRSDEDISFAFQGVIGTDYFITPEWSIFTEYRLLAYQSLGLFSTPQISFDRLYNNLVTFGVRRNF
jgi:opacity protein-like surface antigen